MDVLIEKRKPWNELYKEVMMSNQIVVDVGSELEEIMLIPSNILTKVRLSLSGGYITVRNLNIRITPLVSRKSGLSAKLYLRDTSDTTGSKLHLTKHLDLGRETRLSMQHIDFACPANQGYPIAFGFEDLVSPFMEGRALFSVSLKWRFGLSDRSYSLPASIMKVQITEELLKRTQTKTN